jgi:hypothetical protein
MAQPRYITDHEDVPQSIGSFRSVYCARCGAENRMHRSWAEHAARIAGGDWEDYATPIPAGSTYRPIGEAKPLTETTARPVEPDFTPGRYLVTFDRIGRDHPASLKTSASTGPELADRIYDYALRHVGSSDLDVDVKWDGTGYLNVGGVRNEGDFTWELPVADATCMVVLEQGGTGRLHVGTVLVADATLDAVLRQAGTGEATA